MSACIIVFPAVNLGKREGYEVPKGLTAARNFIQNQYDEIERCTPGELALRHRRICAAWDAIPVVAPERDEEAELYRKHIYSFFRNCLREGVTPRSVAKAMLLRASTKVEINDAFIELGSRRLKSVSGWFGFDAFEEALSGC